MSNRKIDTARFVVGNKTFSKLIEAATLNLLPGLAHQVHPAGVGQPRGVRVVLIDQAGPSGRATRSLRDGAQEFLLL